MNMGKNGMLNPDTSILTVKNNSKNYQLISARHKAYLLKSVIGMPVQQKYEFSTQLQASCYRIMAFLVIQSSSSLGNT